MRCASILSTRTGWKVPKPTCKVSLARRAPPSRTRSRIAASECRPAVGAATAPEEPRFDDARVVQHYGVALLDQAGQLGEEAVVQRAARIDMQQAARAAFRGRALGNEFAGQRIVELGDQHPRQL